ncbi:hypothetical protein [Paraburkholderia lacunae]|uniref:Uncharacterized protein n=1 Tax=Paraburkholderia lacunae TaxID=2211104 RepID=A0A370MZD4_9BURK|nr:hypothetical protein [Paraburkholderia lacunae]RDJ98741.1 hypothetical protein DLM46_31905 [Paraburkholderia lacunae]
MNTKVAIFEPIYAQDQVQVEKSFLPLVIQDNSQAGWREFKLFVDMYRSGEHRRHAYTGIFSPKFSLKSKITGAEFIRFVQSQPGSDVCFINPFPQIGYWSFNVWMQGEHAHPGLADAAQSLLDACKVDFDIERTPRHGPGLLAYSNFWVGSERFWDEYVGGVLVRIAEFLEENPDHEVTRKVMEDTTHTDPAPFLPFIVERLFSTYISQRPELKIAAYRHGDDGVLDYCVNEYERRLVARMKQQVDEANAVGKFDDTIIKQMDIACELWQQQFFDYFAVRPHPHTGRCVN